jgi:hypothetical protein
MVVVVVVVVVVVYNSNSVVVVHFLMSTNERTKVGKEEKNKTPSSELPPYPFFGALQLFPTAKWYLNFFLDVDKRKKYWEMGSMGVGRGLGFFFFFFFFFFLKIFM